VARERVSVPRSELNLSPLNKFAHRGKGRKEATIIKIHKPIHPRGISFGRVRARALVAAASLSLFLAHRLTRLKMLQQPVCTHYLPQAVIPESRNQIRPDAAQLNANRLQRQCSVSF
jgi:hypothetical protein